jgi:riboflavin biosynthesis pyrimidine reductase
MGGRLVELSDAASVDRAARILFGSALESRPFVSHSGAVWNDPESQRLTTIRITDYAPKSDLDFLSLHIARARADAIIITGKILRDEPSLCFDLRADARWGDALVEWRERTWGLWERPWLLILTASGKLDFAHPALRGWPRPMIFTSDRTAARKLADSPFPVVADAEPSIRGAIRHLQVTRDCHCISIEAGPSTAVSLYDPPAVVNELLLSVYLDRTLDDRARGKPLIELARLRSRFRSETSATHRCQGQRWSFHRFRR